MRNGQKWGKNETKQGRDGTKFRGHTKETGMKLQGKVEMKDPHPPVALIPLRS